MFPACFFGVGRVEEELGGSEEGVGGSLEGVRAWWWRIRGVRIGGIRGGKCDRGPAVVGEEVLVFG